MGNKARILGARAGDEELPSRAAQEQIFSIMQRDMKVSLWMAIYVCVCVSLFLYSITNPPINALIP